MAAHQQLPIDRPYDPPEPIHDFRVLNARVASARPVPIVVADVWTPSDTHSTHGSLEDTQISQVVVGAELETGERGRSRLREIDAVSGRNADKDLILRLHIPPPIFPAGPADDHPGGYSPEQLALVSSMIQPLLDEPKGTDWLASRPPTPHNPWRSEFILAPGTLWWTEPLWRDAGIDSETIMDPDNYLEEVWAWTLLEAAEEMVSERRQRGDLSLPWSGRLTVRWMEREFEMLENLEERDLERAMDWVSRDFLKRTDYWRSRVGWSADANLMGDQRIEWVIPSNQQEAVVLRLQHPNGDADSQCEGVISGIGVGADAQDLIRLHWVRKLWDEQPHVL